VWEDGEVLTLTSYPMCARQSALTSWLKSNAHPARGSASRTARVSVARPNPKEAEGKTLTPGQMLHVIQTAKLNGIKVVFISPQFNSLQAEAIAAEIGGSVLAVDPLAADYQENLRRATSLFLKAGDE